MIKNYSPIVAAIYCDNPACDFQIMVVSDTAYLNNEAIRKLAGLEVFTIITAEKDKKDYCRDCYEEMKIHWEVGNE